MSDSIQKQTEAFRDISRVKVLHFYLESLKLEVSFDKEKRLSLSIYMCISIYLSISYIQSGP